MMMKHNSKKKRAFYVVQFIELPFEGIDDYVCVPSTWLIVRRAMDQKAVVSYPKDEDPFDTRNRVKSEERCNDEWRFYMAVIKYESDTYKDAEYWIATRNDYGPLVEEESKIKDTLPRVTLIEKLPCANQSHSSKSNDNPRKPLPKISIKRPGLSKPKKQLDRKRLKLSEGSQLFSADVDDSNAKPKHSRKQQLIINQDNQSIEYDQTKENAAASNSDESTKQRTQMQRIEQKKQALSLPVIDDEPSEVINIDDVKKPNDYNNISQRHLSSNVTAASITTMEPSNSAEKTTQSNQYNNHEHILNSESSFLNFQPRIENVRSIANVHNDHELRDNEVSVSELSTSHETLDSLKMTAHLYSHMSGAQQLVQIQKPVEKEIRLMNITKNLSIAAQKPSNLIHQTGSLPPHSVEQPSVLTHNQSEDGQRLLQMHIENSRDQTAAAWTNVISSQGVQHVPKMNFKVPNDVAGVDPRNMLQSIPNIASTSPNFKSSSNQRPSFVRQVDGPQRSPTQKQYLAPPHHNQYLPTNQNSFEQDVPKRSPEGNNYDYRPNPRTIRMRIPSNGQNLTHTSNPLQQTFELPQQRQSQPNYLNAQQQPQKPKIRIGISFNPKNNRQKPTLQGITKKTRQPIIMKVLNSIRQALSTTHSDNLLNEQQLQISQSRSLHPGSHLKAMDNACQTDDCMVEGTPLPYQSVTSDSDAVTDHEIISDHEMSGDELPVKITNNSYDSGIGSRSNSVERPTAAQNLTSTNHQTHPRLVLEQKMLDNFSSLFTQMGSTLRYTCDMYNNLRDSIHETAETYRCLLDAVDKFNTAQNSASNAFPSSNLPPQVPPATHERYVEATATTNLSNKDRRSHDLANKAPTNNHNNLWRFVLPPEYDPQDTRWTLKYQTNMPGLVELMPQSGIYVGYGELKYCQQVSKDCKSLARRLLLEVFNREALSVCSSISEKSQAPNNAGSNVRPELDEHATSVLLNFVLEHGFQYGWNIDLQPIISILNSKIQEIRFKYGVMVKC